MQLRLKINWEIWKFYLCYGTWVALVVAVFLVGLGTLCFLAFYGPRPQDVVFAFHGIGITVNTAAFATMCIAAVAFGMLFVISKALKLGERYLWVKRGYILKAFPIREEEPQAMRLFAVTEQIKAGKEYMECCLQEEAEGPILSALHADLFRYQDTFQARSLEDLLLFRKTVAEKKAGIKESAERLKKIGKHLKKTERAFWECWRLFRGMALSPYPRDAHFILAEIKAGLKPWPWKVVS